jgi:hypothetical protein
MSDAQKACPMTGYPCTCTMKSEGHWCCWSIPADKVGKPEESDADKRAYADWPSEATERHGENEKEKRGT